MRPLSSRCVFFDRDGVVNRSPGEGYVLSPEQFHLNEGIVEALRFLQEREILAVIATSQKGVGKELMTRADLDRIHQRMAELLSPEGVEFDGVFAHLGNGLPDDLPPKPDPGMIEAAVARFSIDPRQSWLVGDADRDIEMGKRAGLAGTIRVRGDKPITVKADYTVNCTTEIIDILSLIL